MTALVLDLGNSRWKLGCANSGQLLTVEQGSYQESFAPAAICDRQQGDFKRLLVSSVAPGAASEAVVARCEAEFSVAAEWISATDPMPGVTTGYRVPAQLGVDRLIAMVAAYDAVQGPLCVVDAGTAVTIDFVAGDGQHQGGFILPGLVLSRECLLNNTAIPDSPAGADDDQLGRDTANAVALGARLAVAGIIERFVGGSHTLFPGERCTIIMGGGDAAVIEAVLPFTAMRIDHLVLRGLAILADRGDRACAGL